MNSPRILLMFLVIIVSMALYFLQMEILKDKLTKKEFDRKIEALVWFIPFYLVIHLIIIALVGFCYSVYKLFGKINKIGKEDKDKIDDDFYTY